MEVTRYPQREADASVIDAVFTNVRDVQVGTYTSYFCDHLPIVTCIPWTCM